MKFLFYFIIIVNFQQVFSLSLKNSYSLGFDYGTSGVRICVLNKDRQSIHESTVIWNACDDVTEWNNALCSLISSIPIDYRRKICRICVSGTSASALIYDKNAKNVSRKPRMYNFNVLKEKDSYGETAMASIKQYCPLDSATNAATSTLAKLLSWNNEDKIKDNEILFHQADFIAFLLMGSSNQNINSISDWHNALKLGFDIYKLEYPSWLLDLLIKEGISSSCLPKVVEPGKPMGRISDELVKTYEFPEECTVVGGTTDSIAAFLASGAEKSGEAVTSLGSTVAIKLLSEKPVEDSSRGIYSHRLGDQWLVGGASNVGCAILRKLDFSNDELVSLSKEIDPMVDSPLEYYPLCSVGERFPFNDPLKEPVFEPEAKNRKELLHAILQGIARVELKGFEALIELGATPPKQIYTAGGGSKNDIWIKMRERILKVSTRKASVVDAAYGSAVLGFRYSC